MFKRTSFVAVASVVGTVFAIGCGQTSSSPTSPSSLVPSASSASDGRVTANANGPLDQSARSVVQSASSVVHDSRGDSVSPARYLDVVQAKVTEQHGALFFMMVLAGPMPEQPSEPFLLWVFHVDTDPATSPGGLYNEYIVRVRWSGGAFVAEVGDRTGGGAPVFTPPPGVPFSIDGATVKVFVPLGDLGNPSSFGWNAATRPLPPAAYLDFAPNGGVDLATWTQ